MIASLLRETVTHFLSRVRSLIHSYEVKMIKKSELVENSKIDLGQQKHLVEINEMEEKLTMIMMRIQSFEEFRFIVSNYKANSKKSKKIKPEDTIKQVEYQPREVQVIAKEKAVKGCPENFDMLIGQTKEYIALYSSQLH